MATEDDIVKANQPTGGDNANNSNGNSNNSNGNMNNSNGNTSILKDLYWAMEVTVTVYGDKGMAGPLPLDSTDDDPFAPGKVGDFSVSVTFQYVLTHVFLCFVVCIL